MASNKIQQFCVENSLPEEFVNKITSLFFEILLEKTNISVSNIETVNSVSTQINEVKEIVKNNNKPAKQMKTTNKWASKVASVYAEANNVKLEDFPEGSKITKSEILKFITDRNSPKDKAGKKILKLCSGTVKTGGMCNKVGSIVPEGAKNLYCQVHASKWKIFENCEENNSDTETEETPEEIPDDLPDLVKAEPEKPLIEEETQETPEPIEELEETPEDKELKMLNKELFGETDNENSDEELEFDEEPEFPEHSEKDFY